MIGKIRPLEMLILPFLFLAISMTCAVGAVVLAFGPIAGLVTASVFAAALSVLMTACIVWGYKETRNG